MKIVNKSGIPEVLFNALKANWYSGKDEVRDYSITELLNPTKVALLTKRYDDELEVDALSLLWAMMGSAMHVVLEKGSKGKEHLGLFAEKRMGMDILGKRITGGMDIYNANNKSITDFKFQTTWNWIYLDDHIDNLTLQLNAYKILLEANGYEVEKLKVLFIFRDWHEYEITRFTGYPDTRYKELDIRIMDRDEIMGWLEGRVRDLEKYSKLPDDEIPVCTKEERWQKEDSYRIKFKNRIIKRFETEEEAEAFVAEKGYGKIDFRMELPKRCHKYCPANNYCSYYINEVKPHMEVN